MTRSGPKFYLLFDWLVIWTASLPTWGNICPAITHGSFATIKPGTEGDLLTLKLPVMDYLIGEFCMY